MPTPTRPLTILLAGGGTGGHLIPLLSLVHELKKKAPGARLVYVGHSGERFEDIINNEVFDKTYQVRAGKLRRYPLTPLTLVQNLRDMFWVLFGIVQSLFIIQREKPDLLFSKGGFVAVPVGLAARFRNVPIVTHDSDSLPGLANRIIGRAAKVHATGMPAELYKYPAETTRFVGVPIDERFFSESSSALRAKTLRDLGFDKNARVLLVVGGSLGAGSINRNLPMIAAGILASVPNLAIIHIAGKKYEAAVQTEYDLRLDKDQVKRIRVVGFTTDLYRYIAACEVAISRAGATALAELAAQAKPSIIVPSPYLAGGHQLSNAQWFEAREAIWTLPDKSAPELWQKAVLELLHGRKEQRSLADNLSKLAKPSAASELADLIISTAREART